jgi:hypothetical protein
LLGVIKYLNLNSSVNVAVFDVSNILDNYVKRSLQDNEFVLTVLSYIGTMVQITILLHYCSLKFKAIEQLNDSMASPCVQVQPVSKSHYKTAGQALLWGIMLTQPPYLIDLQVLSDAIHGCRYCNLL